MSNQYVTAKANYGNAVTNLKYAEIYSPIDGVVISKQVEEGQTVQGSYSVPNLFTIAKNMTEMQVEAKVDEADIGAVRVGQSVTFKVDAYTGETFSGTVSQIRMEPQNNNNVVTYVVIISAPNPDEKLFPGMTARVTIVTDKGVGTVFPYYAIQLELDESVFEGLRKEGYTIDSSARVNKDSAAVWLKQGRTLRRVPVTVGAKNKVNAVALDGLSEGDSVVVSVVDPIRQQMDRKKRDF